MTIRKALFGLILACGASVISLAACGDDDDDNGGTSGSGGSSGTAGTAGKSTGGSSGATGGSSGVGGTGGAAPALTCKDKYEACNGDQVCAKLIYCGSVCGALGFELSEFLTKCQTYAGYAPGGPQLGQALAVNNCAGGVCANDCGGGGDAGAGGAGAGGAGAGGAGAGGAGAGGAGAGGAVAGASGAGGGGGASGGTAGSGGPTCPPSDFVAPSKCTDSGISACVSCQCSN
jgi:hypothetical protein